MEGRATLACVTTDGLADTRPALEEDAALLARFDPSVLNIIGLL
jgi:hypothetical protein